MITDNNFKDRSVCVLGLGYVGLTLAATMADVGFRVFGVEIRDEVLDKLKKGEPHFHEPGLKECLQRVVRRGNITFSKHLSKESIASVYIITVGTPLGANGKPRLDMITNIAEELSKYLKNGDIVVMRSTVMLGATRQMVLPILKKSGATFDLAFCPERTLEGYALKELRQLPQIVGGLTFEAAVRAAQIFQMLTPTVVRVDDIETAEMIKLVDNSQRDVFFAYSNEIARLCNKTGVNVAQVISAGKLGYPRTNLPLPGPVGGPCLEKDPYILAESVKPFGIQPEIILAARRVNETQPREVVEFLAERTASFQGFPKTPVITLMGIAFKGRPATDDLRGTMARPIFEALKKGFPNARFRGYDPVVSKVDLKGFGLEPCESAMDAFSGSHLALILNNHLEFASMPINDYAEKMARPGLIYDFWNNFAPSDLQFPKDVGYMTLGGHGCALLPGRTA